MANLEAGIVGLPNCGKSTLFNALTGAGAQAEAFPFSTKDVNQGVADVADPRLDELTRVCESRQTIPATLRVVDIAGLVRGASQGEGLGNQFLGHLRTVDAVVHVVRCFESDDVAHVSGRVDPLEDAEIVELELVLADAAALERRAERVSRAAKSGDAAVRAELEQLEALAAWLAEGRPARGFTGPLPEALDLLTAKPTLYVANTDESGNGEAVAALERFAGERGIKVLALDAKLEAELRELPAEDRAAFLDELGMSEPALDRVAPAAYALLDLISFFTAGPKESRAWTIRRGESAQQAAGKIHSDLERGFIRAEVIPWNLLVEAGSTAEAQRRGWLRVEGRDYVVADGDVLNVRFNV